MAYKCPKTPVFSGIFRKQHQIDTASDTNLIPFGKAKRADKASAVLTEMGEDAYLIGEIVKGEEKIILE